MTTIDEIKTIAQQIIDETIKRANTKTRVGGVILAIAQWIERLFDRDVVYASDYNIIPLVGEPTSAAVIANANTNTSLIQQLFNENKGKTIKFSEGLYCINDEIIITNTYSGSGVTHTNNGIKIVGLSSGQTTIRQIRADKNGLVFRPENYGVKSNAFRDITIENIRINISLVSGETMTDFTKSAVRMIQCYNFYITNCWFSSFGVSRALSIEGCDRGYYDNLFLSGSVGQLQYNGDDSALLYLANYQLANGEWADNWVHHFNKFRFEVGWGSADKLNIDVEPAHSWGANDIITGQTSGASCVVLYKISDTQYAVADIEGVFELGEVIGVTGNANKLADQGASMPTITMGSNSRYDTAIMVTRADGLYFENGYISGGKNSQIKIKPLHGATATGLSPASSITKFSLDNIYFDGNVDDRKLKYSIEIPFTDISASIRINISSGCFVGNCYAAGIYSRSPYLEELICNANIRKCDTAVDISGDYNKTQFKMSGNNLTVVGRTFGAEIHPIIRAGSLELLKMNGSTIEGNQGQVVHVVGDIKHLQLCDNINLINSPDINIESGIVANTVLKGNISSRPAVDVHNWSVNCQQNRYLWFDDDGMLRMNGTMPTAHDDGNLIGNQS